VVRIKRLEPAEKGNYRVKITADKPLTKTAVKEAMKEFEEKFPNGLDDLVERQLKVQMERLKALEAMEDDDDEDEEEKTPKARPGKAVADDADDDDEDEDEESTPEVIVDEELEILRASKKYNSITVNFNDEEIELAGDELDISEFRKGDVVTVSAEYDDGEEGWIITSITAEDEPQDEEAEGEAEEEDEEEAEEEAEEDEDSEEVSEISGATYEVLKVQEQDEIFDLQNDEGKVKMWLGDGLEVDYDEIKKGVEIVVDAVLDDEDDWIITAIDIVQPAKPAARKRTAKPKPKPKPRSRRTAK
jgi:hypothetical protein